MRQRLSAWLDDLGDALVKLTETKNLTEDKLIAFLSDTLKADGEIDADSELFSSGVLDSVAMLQLITFVEDTAGIQIRPEDVTLENFDSAARIVRFAESQS
jgi:acyl carrier protein